MPQGRNLAINLVVRSKNAARQLNQFETRTQRLGRALKVGLAAGAVAGGVAVARFAGQSVSAASDLEESFSKVQAVFGDATGQVTKFADTSVTDLGLSKQAALEAVGTFGNLATSFGIGQGKAAEMSTTLTRLAADLASFNNTSVEDAINALRSGLSGETEPLKRYGIVLQDTRLRAEALALGLQVTKGALDPLTKSQAAYSLIMKDSANAQGDFARTSDGLANTQKILAAAVDDAKAEIGVGLVSAVKTAVQSVGGGDGLAQTIKDAAYETGNFTRALGGLADQLATFNKGLGDATDGGVSLATLFRGQLAIGTAGLSEGVFRLVENMTEYGNKLRLVENSNRGLIPVADHLAHSLEEQRKAADRVAKAMQGAAAATFDYRKQRTLAANLDYQDAAARARNRDSWEALEFTVVDYTRSTGGATRATNQNSEAMEKFRGKLDAVNSELAAAQGAVDAALAEFNSFASNVNSALGSGINLASAFNSEQAKAEIAESGKVSAETWIAAFQQQLGDAQAAGEALSRLEGELRNQSGELIPGAEALFQQVLTAPTYLIPQVVDDLINQGLIPNLAGSLNHIFEGPVGEAWAETFRGEGLEASTKLLEGIETQANELKPSFKEVGKGIGAEIRAGIQAEIDAVLAELAALETRVSGARGKRVGAAPQAGRDLRARNAPHAGMDRVAEARVLAQVLRDAEAALGARP